MVEDRKITIKMPSYSFIIYACIEQAATGKEIATASAARAGLTASPCPTHSYLPTPTPTRATP